MFVNLFVYRAVDVNAKCEVAKKWKKQENNDETTTIYYTIFYLT